MKFSAIALVLSVVRASAAVAAPGDPRLIQGALEWPPALTGAEPFIVVRGDDGRVYYADVMAAQRYVQGALSAGGHIALLGLESTQPHEIVAVALGSGDAGALSLTLGEATRTTSLTSSPPPSTAPPGVTPPAPAGEPATMAPARLEEAHPSSRAEGWGVTLRGCVYGITDANQLFLLKSDDGRVVVVDISKLDLSIARRLRLGSPVTVVAVPVGNKFQATGHVETETGPAERNPPKPAHAR